MRSLFATIFIGICALFVYGGKQGANDWAFDKSVSLNKVVLGQNRSVYFKKKGVKKKTIISDIKFKKSKVKGLKISEYTIAISFFKKVVYLNKPEPILTQKVHASFLYCVDQKRGPPSSLV